MIQVILQTASPRSTTLGQRDIFGRKHLQAVMQKGRAVRGTTQSAALVTRLAAQSLVLICTISRLLVLQLPSSSACFSLSRSIYPYARLKWQIGISVDCSIRPSIKLLVVIYQKRLSCKRWTHVQVAKAAMSSTIFIHFTPLHRQEDLDSRRHT